MQELENQIKEIMSNYDRDLSKVIYDAVKDKIMEEMTDNPIFWSEVSKQTQKELNTLTASIHKSPTGEVEVDVYPREMAGWDCQARFNLKKILNDFVKHSFELEDFSEYLISVTESIAND